MSLDLRPGKIQTSLPSIEAIEIIISSDTEKRYDTIHTVNYKGAVQTSQRWRSLTCAFLFVYKVALT